MLTRTNEVLSGFLKSIDALESLPDKQRNFYLEIWELKNTIDLYESCRQDPAKMLQWVRGFSALRIVSQAMSENRINSGFFGGHEGFFHFGRSAWPEASNKYGNVLASVNILIQNMARMAGVQPEQSQQVEEILFEARVDNLRDNPVKLTANDHLVQAFAEEAARKILKNLEEMPPAGKKNCPRA
jgi:hypothetical protein